MKTKTILVVGMVFLLFFFSLPVFAQTSDVISSDADNATTTFFNQALKEKKSKLEDNKVVNEKKISKNQRDFRNKIDSINKVSEGKIKEIIKEDLIQEDSKLFIEARDILEAEITTNDQEITNIMETIGSLKIFLRADLPRRLDSISNNEQLKKAYITSIEKAIKASENIKGSTPMQKNYPNYDLFSTYFGEVESKSEEQRKELIYKMEENLKREAEILRLTEVESLLQGRKDRFIQEEEKIKKLLKREAKEEEESNEALVESEETKQNAVLCLEDLEKYRIKLSAEQNDDEKRLLYTNCTGKTRTTVKGMFRKYRLEEPSISAYDGSNEEMINVAKNKLEELIGK